MDMENIEKLSILKMMKMDGLGGLVSGSILGIQTRR
jgi:hypothetical protein